jgi:hypothetical protein
MGYAGARLASPDRDLDRDRRSETSLDQALAALIVASS